MTKLTKFDKLIGLEKGRLVSCLQAKGTPPSGRISNETCQAPAVEQSRTRAAVHVGRGKRTLSRRVNEEEHILQSTYLSILLSSAFSSFGILVRAVRTFHFALLSR